MSKPVENQLIYKKVLSFTLKQKNAFKVLKKHNVNVNEFIRIAIRAKLKRDWCKIKEEKTKEYYPF